MLVFALLFHKKPPAIESTAFTPEYCKDELQGTSVSAVNHDSAQRLL